MIHDYSLSEQEEINLALRELNRTGNPTLVRDMEMLIADEAPFSKVIKIAKDHFAPVVKPEVPVADLPDAPARNAGTPKWQSFAKQVSDMDPEVVDSMSRKDIITVLEDKGIID